MLAQCVACMEGVIEAAEDAPKLNATQKQAWREQCKRAMSVHRSVGQTPVLETGMTWSWISYSVKESDYVQARKLSGEEAASAVAHPAAARPAISITRRSAISRTAQTAVRDCLGPWLK